MNKFLLLLSFIISSSVFSQSKYTEAQVDKSNDSKVIANFIKYNPEHPKTPEYKRKLYAIIATNTPGIAEPKVEVLTKNKLKKQISSNAKTGSNSKNQGAAEVLTHLFNNDPKKREAYIQIENQSACNMIVKINGKKFYNLTVPANNSNYLLVDKGTYTLSTSVCDAQYSSVKNVSKDIVITLKSPKSK